MLPVRQQTGSVEMMVQDCVDRLLEMEQAQLKTRGDLALYQRLQRKSAHPDAWIYPSMNMAETPGGGIMSATVGIEVKNGECLIFLVESQRPSAIAAQLVGTCPCSALLPLPIIRQPDAPA